MYVLRLDTAGAEDTSFDTDGWASATIGVYCAHRASAISVQEDQKILVGGVTSSALNNIQFAILRYDSTGTLDNSFDTDGKVETDIAGFTTETAFFLDIDQQGRILLAGWDEGSGNDIIVVRYLTNGSLDSGFNTNGILIKNYATYHKPRGFELTSNGQFIVFGYNFNAAKTFILKFWP